MPHRMPWLDASVIYKNLVKSRYFHSGPSLFSTLPTCILCRYPLLLTCRVPDGLLMSHTNAPHGVVSCPKRAPTACYSYIT